MAFRKVDIGMAPVWLSRMTYTGDLGYEIWVQPEYQRYLFDLLWEAGREFDMRLFGFRALITMRLEKSFGTWFREYRPIYTPLEAGMDRVVKFDHDFIGRAAVEAEIADGGPKRKLMMFVVEPDPDSPADVIGDEPVWHTGPDGDRWSAGSPAAATPTTPACRWRGATSRPSSPTPGTAGFEIEIIGKRRPARLQLEPVLDPPAPECACATLRTGDSAFGRSRALRAPLGSDRAATRDKECQ